MFAKLRKSLKPSKSKRASRTTTTPEPCCHACGQQIPYDSPDGSETSDFSSSTHSRSRSNSSAFDSGYDSGSRHSSSDAGDEADTIHYAKTPTRQATWTSSIYSNSGVSLHSNEDDERPTPMSDEAFDEIFDLPQRSFSNYSRKFNPTPPPGYARLDTHVESPTSWRADGAASGTIVGGYEQIDQVESPVSMEAPSRFAMLNDNDMDSPPIKSSRSRYAVLNDPDPEDWQHPSSARTFGNGNRYDEPVTPNKASGPRSRYAVLNDLETETEIPSSSSATARPVSLPAPARAVKSDAEERKRRTIQSLESLIVLPSQLRREVVA